METTVKTLNTFYLPFDRNINCIYTEKGSIADIVGVYAEPTSKIFGMSPLNTTTPATKSITVANGVVLIELSYYCTLLIQGNHRAFELLFIDHLEHIGFESDMWTALKLQRSKFITKPLFQHYLGVAQGILLKGNLMSSDPAIIGQQVGLATILLTTARRIASRETPVVDYRHDFREDPEVRRVQNDINEIRRIDTEGWKEKANSVFQRGNSEVQELKKLKTELDALPEPPKSELNAWLIQARKALYVISKSKS